MSVHPNSASKSLLQGKYIFIIVLGTKYLLSEPPLSSKVNVKMNGYFSPHLVTQVSFPPDTVKIIAAYLSCWAINV